MTSRPLFIIDAESMVIFCPMLQFGCFRACASVACSISALAQVRNGPPDAVMMTRTSSSAVAGAQCLEQRVVLGIGRQDAGPGLGGTLHEKITGANQAFLVGQRHAGAAIDRRERGLQPGRAADGGHHPVRRTGRGLDNSAFTGARIRCGVPANASFSSLRRPGSATAAKRAPNSLASLANPCTLVFAVSASTW